MFRSSKEDQEEQLTATDGFIKKHIEAIIVAGIAIAVLGGYHWIYVPQLISQAKQEQASIDTEKIDELKRKISRLQLENEELESAKDEAESNLESTRQQAYDAPTYTPYIPYNDDTDIDIDDTDIDDLNDRLDRQESELQNLKDKYNDAEEKRYTKEYNEWIHHKRKLPPESPDYE